mmetsp:Transcript_27212/g.41164  ORF Transcript_27212/g.41164 Transcript_27212/m.41164 type:complete len:269 (-) Transcript_27212:412-1218(-)
MTSLETGTASDIVSSEVCMLDTLVALQRWAHILSHVLALVALVFVSWWIHTLGGFSTMSSKLVFNYHPLFMVVAFCFMTVATLAFRHYIFLQRWQRKLVHGLSWTIAAVCAIVAFVAVFQSHNDPTSGYIPNLYSLHSWVGVMVTIFYILQWASAFGAFGLGYGSPTFKSVLVKIHKYVGPVLYQSVALTMCLGIQEKEGFIGCGYKVEERDTFGPFQHFFDIPLACRVGHALTFVILTLTILTTFAIQDFSKVDRSQYQVVPSTSLE